MTHLVSQYGFSYARDICNSKEEDLMEQNQPPAPAPAPTPAPASPGATKVPQGLAIAALVVGIVAFLSGWAPVFGMIVGIAAVVLGVVATVKKQNKVMSIFGIVLGGLAIIASLLATLFWGAVFHAGTTYTNQVNQERQAVDNAKKDFATGETAQFDMLSVKVMTFTPNWQASDGYSQPADGKQFALVSLSIKNTGNEDVNVNPFDFKIDENGTLSSYDFTTTDNGLNAVTLKPGASVNGDLVFQTSPNATGLKLQYSTYSTDALKEVNYTVGLN